MGHHYHYEHVGPKCIMFFIINITKTCKINSPKQSRKVYSFHIIFATFQTFVLLKQIFNTTAMLFLVSSNNTHQITVHESPPYIHLLILLYYYNTIICSEAVPRHAKILQTESSKPWWKR